jgi:hypothetical protein
MSVKEARNRFTEIEKELAIASDHERELEALVNKFALELEAVPPCGHGVDVVSANLRLTLQQLQRGASRTEGIAFEEVVPLAGKPGLIATRRTVERLRAERETVRALLERWPDDNTTHLFRYTGRPFMSRIAGRYLEPGDVVPLALTTATACADRFEPVEEEPATT